MRELDLAPCSHLCVRVFETQSAMILRSCKSVWATWISVHGCISQPALSRFRAATFRINCLYPFNFIFSSFPCNWHTWYEEEYLSISKVPSLSLRSMMRWWKTSQKNEWMNFFFNLDLTRECSFSWKTTDLLCCCSVAQSCLTLCDPMNGSMPGFSVHCLPEFAQTHVLWVDNAYAVREIT